ncbi:hypothetical protein SLA2020_497160 [Shorea laevis]
MRYNEITHCSHPQHKLKLKDSEILFKCDGCKEFGNGSSYRCDFCNFDLHVHCAIPSPSISHPLFPKCSFQFLSRPPGDKPRYCDACKKDINGFVYHCKCRGFYLHPCCAELPSVLNDGEVELSLRGKMSARCNKCRREWRSWSYRSACKKYNFHVACVREMLVENWHELYLGRGKGSGRKLETRIPGLKNTLQITPHQMGKGKKVKKCFEMAFLALRLLISAVLGDPTVLIAGVIGN